MRVLIACAVVASLLWPGLSSAREKVKVTTVKVTDNISMLQGRGGNLGVLTGEDGVLIIDSDYPGVVDAHREALKKLQSDKPVFLINTHFHADHAGGNKAFGETATIVAHDNVRVRLMAGKDLSDEATRRSLPTITYGESMSVHFNGEELKLLHYPMGHTDGDTVIVFTGANVAHLGDHFFVDIFPFIDLVSGGSVQGYLKNVRALIEDLPDDITIIPGHGPLTDKDGLRRFEKLIAESSGIIQKGIDAGKDLDTLTAEGLPEKFDSAQWQFISTDRWIGIVYKSLTEL